MRRRVWIVGGIFVVLVILWLILWCWQGAVRGTTNWCVVGYLLLAALAAVRPGWLASPADGVQEDGTIRWSRLGWILTIVGMHLGIAIGALDVYGQMHIAIGPLFAIGKGDLELVDVILGIRQFAGHVLTGAAVGGLVALLAGATLGRSFAVVLGGSVGWFLGIALCFLSHDAQSPTITWLALAWLAFAVGLGWLCRNRIAGFGRLARRWTGIVTLPAFAAASWKLAALSQYFAFDASRSPNLTVIQRLEIAWRWNGGAITFVLLSGGVLAGGLGAIIASQVFRRRTGVATDTVRTRRCVWPVAWTIAALLLVVSAVHLRHERLQELEFVGTLPENQFGFRVGPKADPIVEPSFRDLWHISRGRHERSENGKAVFEIVRGLGSQPPQEIVVLVGMGDVIGSSSGSAPLAISRDGRRLAWAVTTCSESRGPHGREFSTVTKIGIGDLDEAAVLAETEVSGHADSLTLSPKGDRLAIWLAGQWVVYDADGLRETARWGAGNQSNYSFRQVRFPGAFSPNGSLFAHLVFDREGSDAPWRLDVREVDRGKSASTRLQESDRWIAVAFQNSSTVILAGQKRFLAWQVDSDNHLRLTHSHEWGPRQFTCSALSQDGRVAIGWGIVPGHSYQQHAGHLLRLPDGAFLGRIPQSPDPHTGCSLSSDGTCFVQRTYQDELKVWRMTASQVKRLEQAP